MAADSANSPGAALSWMIMKRRGVGGPEGGVDDGVQILVAHGLVVENMGLVHGVEDVVVGLLLLFGEPFGGEGGEIRDDAFFKGEGHPEHLIREAVFGKVVGEALLVPELHPVVHQVDPLGIELSAGVQGVIHLDLQVVVDAGVKAGAEADVAQAHVKVVVLVEICPEFFL